MRLFLSCGLLWVGMSGAVALGQTGPAGPVTTLVEPPAPLLPESLGGAKLTSENHGDAATASFGQDCEPQPANAAGASDRCAQLMKEDGLQRWAVNTYERGGSATTVFAEQFQDATSAFSSYTFYRSQMHGARVSGAEARLNKAANEMATDAGGYLVWAGTAVMRVTGRVSTEELIGLTSGLPKVGGRRGLAPLLPTLLPAPGLETASVRYAIGPVGYQAEGGQLPVDVLGWDKSVEVATASYAGKPGHGTLTLLLYPTPQIAGDRLKAVQQAVDAAKDQSFGTIVMRRLGPLVGVATGGWTEDQAKALLGSLRLHEEVSFDQKMPLEFHAEVKKTASLLENIAVFSGILIVGAILLGLFLGFGRAGWRRLRGKPAYTEPEFLTISLRESESEHFEKIHSEQPKS